VPLVITLDGCSRRTQWSSLLDWTSTYTTFTVAVLLVHNHMFFQNVLVITWSCHVTLVPILFTSQPHCTFWGSRSSVQMLGKLFPFWGFHNKDQCYVQTLRTLHLHGILSPLDLFMAKRSALKRASWWSLKQMIMLSGSQDISNLVSGDLVITDWSADNLVNIDCFETFLVLFRRSS